MIERESKREYKKVKERVREREDLFWSKALGLLRCWGVPGQLKSAMRKQTHRNREKKENRKENRNRNRRAAFSADFPTRRGVLPITVQSRRRKSKCFKKKIRVFSVNYRID